LGGSVTPWRRPRAAWSSLPDHGGGRAELPVWGLALAHGGGADGSRLSRAPSTLRRRRSAASLHRAVILRPAPRRRLATSPHHHLAPPPPRGSLRGHQWETHISLTSIHLRKMFGSRKMHSENSPICGNVLLKSPCVAD
jgi:hypothetical protein